MRKIEQELCAAIANRRPFSKGNTVFHRMPNTEHGWELVLHGYVIASFDDGADFYPIPTYVNLCGWPKKTTCSRLNALAGVSVRIRKHVPYLNGKEIDSDGWFNPRTGNCW